MRWLVVVCLLIACGRIGFDERDAADDAPIVGRWRSAATSALATCAITNSGALWCWGEGLESNLGNGAITLQPPARVGTFDDWTTVALGEVMTCGLRSDATLWCWGTSVAGAIPGAPADAIVEAPRQVGSGTYGKLSAAFRHACAIDSSGVLVCWGENDVGLLGNGSTATAVTTPTEVAAVGTNRWLEVSTSTFTTCGIQTDDSLWCWGYNNAAQVGDDSQTQRNAPVQIGIGRRFTSVATAPEHTCAIEQGGATWCWGYGYFGQLGDGRALTGGYQRTPIEATRIPPLSALALGRWHSCGLTLAGSSVCWGNGERGQLGVVLGYSPDPITLAPAATSVIAGGDVTCFIDPGAHLACTGANAFGQAGGTPGLGTTLVQSDTRTDWERVVAMTEHACATTKTGSVECWGVNHFGELANGSPEDIDTPHVTARAFTRLLLGTYTFGGLDDDGTVWLSGLYPDLATTTLVPTLYTTGEAMSIGDQHMCWIRSDASLACGGLNNRGQLGDGTTVDKETAVIGGTWQLIAAGSSSTCAITTAGQLMCWGRNDAGQLGLGTTDDALTPQPVTLAGPLRVSLGFNFTCAVTAAGELYCWGAGDQGQLGNGSRSGSTMPVRVGTATDWTAVTAGDAHACGIRADATLWCWGHGDYGQCGPELIDHPTPVQVGGADWRDVSAGAHFTCATKQNGTRWCVGTNANGELGNDLGWRDQFVVIP